MLLVFALKHVVFHRIVPQMLIGAMKRRPAESYPLSPAKRFHSSSAAHSGETVVKRRPAHEHAPTVHKKPAIARKDIAYQRKGAGRQRPISASTAGADNVVALAAAKKGVVIFTEHPAVAVQHVRSEGEHLAQQPLFCAEHFCSGPAGPIEAALALGAGRVSRAELLEFARSNDGDAPGLLRWLDFASKTAGLPRVVVPGLPDDSSERCLVVAKSAAIDNDVVDDHPQLDGKEAFVQTCFCSHRCRERWLASGHPEAVSQGRSVAWRAVANHAFSSGHEALLLMAAELIFQAAFQTPALNAPVVERALKPMLSLIRAAGAGATPSLGVPRRVLSKARQLLLDLCVEHAMRTSKSRGASVVRRQAQTAIPFSLYLQLVAVLDARCWALSGANMPSLLGKYCEAVCRPGVERQIQHEVAAAIAPVVKELCEQQDQLRSDQSDEEGSDKCDEENATTETTRLMLPCPEVARSMEPVVLQQAFSSDDIARLKALSKEMSAREHKKHASSSQWRTRYLHAGGAMRKRAPDLLSKLIHAALAADSQPGGWQFSQKLDVTRLRPRVIEHHLVSPGGALPDPTHFDGGSLFTVDIMLSDPGVDFTGGEFCTTESDGKCKLHAFGKGDALVFVSHKPHHVQPVCTGFRETLIMELWDGEERTCDHRCPQHRGVCPLEVRTHEAGDVSNGHALGDSSESCLTLLESDAARAFASSAFDGYAFFPRVARIMEQSDSLRRRGRSASLATPNVEVVFEDLAPRATVRALRKIRRGELLVTPAYDDVSEEQSSEEDEEGHGSSESQDDPQR